MTPDIDTSEHTVDELIQLWMQGDLSVEHGEVQQLDGSSLQVVFQGSEEKLYLNFTLQEGLTGRSDEEGHFDIMAADPDVEKKPLPVRDSDEQ